MPSSVTKAIRINPGSVTGLGLQLTRAAAAMDCTVTSPFRWPEYVTAPPAAAAVATIATPASVPMVAVVAAAAPAVAAVAMAEAIWVYACGS